MFIQASAAASGSGNGSSWPRGLRLLHPLDEIVRDFVTRLS